MKTLRRLRILLLLAGCAWLVADCGPGGAGTCVPTVIEGLELAVNPLSSDTYEFEVCTTPAGSPVFSVYGGASSSDVSGSFDVNAAVRQAHITGAQAGSTFQVTFKSSDNYYSIYKDSDTGGGPQLDNSTTPLVAARLLPGH